MILPMHFNKDVFPDPLLPINKVIRPSSIVKDTSLIAGYLLFLYLSKICSPLISSLVCVDLMIKDFKKPADENNYNLIELNLGMSLPLCYSARDGRNFTIIENYLGPKVLKEFEKLE